MAQEAQGEEKEVGMSQLDSIYEWINDVLDGKEVSEYALSFPIVKKCADALNERDEDENQAIRNSDDDRAEDTF